MIIFPEANNTSPETNTCKGQINNYFFNKKEKIDEELSLKKHSILSELKGLQIKLNLLIECLEKNSFEAIENNLPKLPLIATMNSLENESRNLNLEARVNSTYKSVRFEELYAFPSRKNNLGATEVLPKSRRTITRTSSLESVESAKQAFKTNSLANILATFSTDNIKIHVKGKKLPKRFKTDPSLRSFNLDFKTTPWKYIQKTQSFDHTVENQSPPKKKLKNPSIPVPKKITKNYKTFCNESFIQIKCEKEDRKGKKGKKSTNVITLNEQKEHENSVCGNKKTDNIKTITLKEIQGDDKTTTYRHRIPVAKFNQDISQYTFYHQNSDLTKPKNVSLLQKRPKTADEKRSVEQKLRTGSEMPKIPIKRLNTTASIHRREISKKETNEKIFKSTLKKISETSTKENDKREGIQEPVTKKNISKSIKILKMPKPQSKIQIDTCVENVGEKVKTTEVKERKSKSPQKHEKEKGKDKKGNSIQPSNLKNTKPPSDETKKLTEGRSDLSKSTKVMTESSKASLENLIENKKMDQILIFDKRNDNIFVGSNCSTPRNQDAQVIVELLPKKPKSMTELCVADTTRQPSNSNLGNGSDYMPTMPGDITMPDEKEKKISDKSVVKSVWALTKVLLYEDGTKDFEVLKASLKPPQFNMTNEKPIQDKVF